MKLIISLFLLISVSPLTAINSETYTWAKNLASHIEFKRGAQAVGADVTNLASAAYDALPSRDAVESALGSGELAIRNLISENPLATHLTGSAISMGAVIAGFCYINSLREQAPEGKEYNELETFMGEIDAFFYRTSSVYYDYDSVTYAVELRKFKSRIDTLTTSSLPKEIQDAFEHYKKLVKNGAQDEIKQASNALKIEMQVACDSIKFWNQIAPKSPYVLGSLAAAGLAGLGLVIASLSAKAL